MSRLDLQARLDAIGEKHGFKVYYQPPDNVTLKYPCIVYGDSGFTDNRADNIHYVIRTRYQITFMTKDADSNIPKEILVAVKHGKLERKFTRDNLYHTVISCLELY